MDWSLLIYELRNGNNALLKTFYEQHSNYCIQRLTKENKCTHEDGEDIFIESVMNLREKLISGRVESVVNVRSYLYKTCHNMFLVRLDQNARMKKHLSEIERFYYDSDYLIENEVFDPELMVISKKAWNYLSERCKDIIHYFYVDKLDMQEIANLMGLANANVTKTTKSRCYKKFIEKAYELRGIVGDSITK